MKTLAIRYWLAAALATYFIGAVAPFVIVGTFVCNYSSTSVQVATIANTLSTNVARWSDPAWQKELAALLPPKLSVVLLNADHEVFRFGKPPRDPTPAGYTQIIVMDGGRQAGTANLYDVSPCGGEIYFSLALPISIAVQFLLGLGIAAVLSRYVLRPIAAISIAARKIAGNDLDFQIPRSRVREVAEVATAFHAMGDALRSALTRQAELEQERRFFIGAIAHDLRTPLFALRGYLEGLEQGLATTPEKTAHYIAVCKEKADALERLIADLFDFTRLEYLEQTPHRAPMDFGKLATKSVDDIQLRAQVQRVSVCVEGPDTPCEVNADESQLARVLGNLLDNALQYTPAGGHIELSWRRDGTMIQFSVMDSGLGIMAKDLPHLFTPLYRAETSRSHETGGAGLGLAIAQRIMRAHGGDLLAANGPTGGAQFTGRFPIM